MRWEDNTGRKGDMKSTSKSAQALLHRCISTTKKNQLKYRMITNTYEYIFCFSKYFFKSIYYNMLTIMKLMNGENMIHYYNSNIEYYSGAVKRFGDLAQNNTLKNIVDMILGKNKQKKKVVGFDLTFSVPKSVSIAFAGLKDMRDRILDAHHSAIQQTIQKVTQDKNITVRIKGERHTIQKEKLNYFFVDHYSNRNLDMQLHTHCILANIYADGNKKRALTVEKRLLDTQKEYGKFYRKTLYANLKQLGFNVYVTDKNNFYFEIKELEQYKKRFSTRREQIQMRKEIYNDSDRKAFYRTRKNKKIIKFETVEKKWEQRLWHTKIGESLKNIKNKIIKFADIRKTFDGLIERTKKKLEETKKRFKQQVNEREFDELILESIGDTKNGKNRQNKAQKNTQKNIRTSEEFYTKLKYVFQHKYNLDKKHRGIRVA